MNKIENSEMVTLTDLILVRVTEQAFGVTTDTSIETEAWMADSDLEPDVEFWIPKSIVGDHSLARGSEGSADVPKWWADREELNYDE